MNYIELINRFWQCEIERVSAPSDAKLYFYLVHTCNKLRWKQPFGHSDRHLSGALNVAVGTVREAKNRLKQNGLIDFKAPDKKSKGMDGQSKFWFPTVSITDTDSDTVPDTVTPTAYTSHRSPTVSNIDTVPDTDADTVIDTVPDTVSGDNTKHKLNQTKPNSSTAPASAGDEILEVEGEEVFADGVEEQLNPTPHSAPPPSLELSEEEQAELDYYLHLLQTDRKVLLSIKDQFGLEGLDAKQWIAHFVTYQWSHDNLIGRDPKDLVKHCQSWIGKQYAKHKEREQKQSTRNNSNKRNGSNQTRSETGSDLDRLSEKFFGY